MEKEYNGYTNYATWLLQVELVDDAYQVMFDPFIAYLHDEGIENDYALNKSLENDEELKTEILSWIKNMIQDYVDECLTSGGVNDNDIAVSYARRFVADANFWELADHFLEYAKDQTFEIKTRPWNGKSI